MCTAQKNHIFTPRRTIFYVPVCSYQWYIDNSIIINEGKPDLPGSMCLELEGKGQEVNISRDQSQDKTGSGKEISIIAKQF